MFGVGLVSVATLASRRPSAATRLDAVWSWARRVGLLLKLEVALALSATASAITTYVLLSSDPAPERAHSISALLTVDLLLLLPLALLIGRRIVLVWSNLRKGSAGSRLHVRLALLFSAVAAFPPAIMAIASVLFLELGLESWFSANVRATVNNSLAVAEAYVQEHRDNLQVDLLGMSSEVAQGGLLIDMRPLDLQAFAADSANRRNLDEVIIFDAAGETYARYSRDTLNLRPTSRVPEEVLAPAREGSPVIAKVASDNKVLALMKLPSVDEVYLYVSRRLDPATLAHIASAKAAVAQYNTLEGRRADLHVRFNAIFIVVSLILLLVAMWIGLWFADRLVRPISELAAAAERVRKGELGARVLGHPGYDEIGVLSRTFNRMTEQLEHQQRALVEANTALDDRMRFLEAVLSDVSAGVLGVSGDGSIDLVNRSAALMLGQDTDLLIGNPLAVAIPEFEPLRVQALTAEEGTAQTHVTLDRSGGERILLVRLTAQRDAEQILGFVVTFDDITDQLADQRNAAWSDVARRIAHEIKNPLTPIQLSAERLKRRYGRLADVEDQVFVQCTDTIIRQVSDLRRMVNEFSSFARMPAARFAEEDLAELVAQTVFMQEVATPSIELVYQRPDMPVPVLCDGRLIAQALTNLLKNAAEAIDSRIRGGDERPGRIEVQIVQKRKATCLVVEDNGRGLPKDRSRLTEPYVTTRVKGTGLGLAIVKRIMEEHGGHLTLENGTNGGARVTLALDRDLIAARIGGLESSGTAEAAHGS